MTKTYWESSVLDYYKTTYRQPSPLQDSKLHKEITQKRYQKLTIDDLKPKKKKRRKRKRKTKK